MAASRSDTLVLFGVTGDLPHTMTFPALYTMMKHGSLKVPVIGIAFPKWNMQRLHRRVADCIERSGGIVSKIAGKDFVGEQRDLYLSEERPGRKHLTSGC